MFARSVLYFVFLASGASALVFQAGWQRILSLHAGMDLFSVTTVVAAFMAGLGLGNLFGGWLADRFRPRAAVWAYATAELLIGAFGWSSVFILYESYPAFSEYITSTARAFAFHFALLVVPTCLMGMTLPLLARGVVEKNLEIAPLVGRLYGVNAFGAALGALATSGGWLLGRIGLEYAIYAAATLNLCCGLLALGFGWRIEGEGTASLEAKPAADRMAPNRSVLAWTAIYGLTGFAALGLEVAWFRLLNVVGTSSTYTFSRLLFVYLVGLGLGSLWGSQLAPKVARPDRVVLWLQWAIGLWALIGPWLVVRYFGLEGMKLRQFPRNVLAPLVVLLLPTLLMGLSFPFLQRLVAQRVETLGRRVGTLLFSNTLGCVAGTLVTGFVLLHLFGTPATIRVLAALLCLLGLAAAIGDRQWGRGAAAVGAYGLFAALLPDGSAFWAPLHGAKAGAVMVHEDGSCVLSLIEDRPGQFNLYIAGERQNGIPFDDFHVRLGAVPALLHPSPRRVLVIGLGAGSTPFGLAMDGRVESIECVEICPGELPLLKALEKRRQEMQRLFSESRIRYRFQDGRKYLLDTSERFDLIVTDTLLTLSAFSGSLYSKEFYELVRARLNEGGMFAQWVPSDRILQTAASVFSHLAVVHSPELPEGEPLFFVASDRPIAVDREGLLERFDAADRRGLAEDAASRLWAFLSTAAAMPPPGPAFPPEQLNYDLFPRDEYANW